MNPDCGSVNTYSSINLHQDRVRPELNQLMIGGRTLSHLSLLYCSKPNIVSLQVIHFCPSAVSSSLRILLSSVFPEAPSVDSNNAILDSDNWVCHLQTACQPELTTASGQSRRDGSDTGEEYKKTWDTEDDGDICYGCSSPQVAWVTHTLFNTRHYSASARPSLTPSCQIVGKRWQRTLQHIRLFPHYIHTGDSTTAAWPWL